MFTMFRVPFVILAVLSVACFVVPPARAACGDTGKPTCTYKKATFKRSVKCSGSEFFDPRKGGECWSCPKGTNRTAYAVDSDNACSKPGYTKKKKGNKKNKSTVGICPGGQWVSLHNGYCYACPGGYSHDPTKSGNKSGVCYKGFDESLKKASFKHATTCKKGEFKDPRKGGECWSCGEWNRTATAVTDKHACQAKSPCKKGNIAVGGTCHKKLKCGKKGQRPCLLVERVPSCDDGLREDFGNNECVELKEGESAFFAGLASLFEEVGKGSEICKTVLKEVSTINLDMPKEAALSANCGKRASIGFVCSAPRLGDRIAGASNVVDKVVAQHNRNPCKKTMEPVRSACATGMVLKKATVDPLVCLGAMVEDGVLAEAFKVKPGKTSDRFCEFIGEQVFDRAVSSLLGKVDANKDLKRLISALKKINKVVKTGNRADRIIEAVNKIESCHGIFGEGKKATAAGGDSANKADERKLAGIQFMLKVKTSGKCLDMTGKKDNGVRHHQWSCNPENRNQTFVAEYFDDDWFALRSLVSNRCVDVWRTKKGNGAAIAQWDCHGKGNQRWRLLARDGDWYSFEVKHSGKCLDLAQGKKTDGAQFHQWNCRAGNTNQLFRVIPVK
jgi:hypothetical protein